MSRLPLVSIAVLATAASAQPEYLPYRMLSSPGAPHAWHLDARVSNPGNLGLSNVQAAMEGAWASWNQVTCALPKTKFAGRSSEPPIPKPNDLFDAYSVMPLWVGSRNDPDWLNVIGDATVSAITVPLAYGGVLQQCDVFVNGADRTYSTATPLPSGTYDLQSVLLHEAGHCLGLDHFGTIEAAMSPIVQPDVVKRTLTQSDIDGLCQRNPSVGGQGSPCDAGACAGGTKCATQLVDGKSLQFCAGGCTVGSGQQACPLPFTCQTSPLVGGAFDGACLRTDGAVTQVGKPCAQSSECGSANGMCQPQVVGPTGQPNWSGGYCFQTCQPGQPACPFGSQCTEVSGGQRVCLKSCRVGLADCRPEYACAVTATGGVCIPSCRADADCGDTSRYFCRTCDGLCVDKQNTTGQLGDACTTFEQCGAGQVCSRVGASPSPICTLGCGRGCAACPNGAACHPVGPEGSLLCLKSCTGPFTCGVGLRCASLATGRGCVPGCQGDGECPVGTRCRQGECLDPSSDAGCAPFCGSDAGQPPDPVIPDAGNGKPQQGGCGCGSAPVGALLLVVVPWHGRRRRASATARV